MRPNGRSPRYLDALLEIGKAAPIGSIIHVEVQHDDDCAFFRDKPCDCEPVVESGIRVEQKYGGER